MEGFTAALWSIKGRMWIGPSNYLFGLLGLARFNPWGSLSHLFIILCSQFLVIVTAACAVTERDSFGNWLDFSWGGLQFRAVLRSILLPIVQLAAGVARPCWISFPFFICSCIGLFHWSITGSFVGLAWGWRKLLAFTGFEIVLLYLYQLPFAFPKLALDIADFVGLFRITGGQSGWLEAVQGISLLAFYILLSVSIYDVEEHDEHSFSHKDLLPRTYDGPMLALPIRRNRESPLTERLLNSPEQSHNGRPPGSWTNTLPNSKILQLISINFFTYGFPVCLLILVLWSFKYASFSAFLILVYVGYVLYSFPSVPTLWRLNTALLGLILLWALCTYVFNAIFTVLHDELDKDPEVWNTIGFWHYPVPGLFLLVQFLLGVLIGSAMYFSNLALRNMHILKEGSCDHGNSFEEDQHDKKIKLLAIMAWCIHRSAHAISLFLIFINGTRHGLVGAIYMFFLLLYMLRSQAAARTRRFLVLFCEIHVGALYLLQLDFISSRIIGENSFMSQLLGIVGVSNRSSPNDFLMIALLLIFSALQNHGLGLLLSIATFVEKSQLPPLGFEILRSTNGVPVLVFVCAAEKLDCFNHDGNVTVQLITSWLSGLGEAMRASYRSFGTSIAALTVLLVVYKLGPNYISFGYFCLLLYWMTGRQLIGRTKTPLWLPLFIYTLFVFVFHYLLTCFPELQKLIGDSINLYPDLGFSPAASFLGNVWDSFLILLVMQLFRSERAQKTREADFGAQGDHIETSYGFLALVKRFFILHSNKILSVTVFYASMSPVGATGFIYLIMLVITCFTPKVSRLPAKFFSMYTALLATAEFLFQLLGEKLQMLPDQIHGPFLYWLGFRAIPNSFWAWESSFQSRTLVFVACLLQYSAFNWLDQLPASLRNTGKLEEPCLLYVPFPRKARDEVQAGPEVQPSTGETRQKLQVGLPEVRSEPDFQSGLHNQGGLTRSHSLEEDTIHSAQTNSKSGPEISAEACIGKQSGINGDYSLNFRSAKQSRQWSKRAMLMLRRERYEAQVRTLKAYGMYMTENAFNLFGVEISMLVLLVASFAVLNVISLFYMTILSLCILLKRHTLKLLWPFFVMLFALILVVEYILFARGPPSWSIPNFVGAHNTRCHTCWRDFQVDLSYCSRCWLGVTVDDWQTLVAYFMVFFVGCLKLKSDICMGKAEAFSFHNILFPPRDKLAWKEINYETKGQWTWLDRVRFFIYRHFLDMVLLLVFITGTLQYDVLHLGYLAFALVFARMRVKILKTRNKIFRYLQLYNFLLMIMSLLYQAPYVGNSTDEGFSLYDTMGFVKIAYGFDITSQSILVDITIFCVVLLQSFIFSSKEYEQVLRYLEAEEMDVKLEAQEAKAAWKTEQLQQIRTMEELKQHRRLQVEKMKSDMLHVQLNVEALNASGKVMENTMFARDFRNRDLLFSSETEQSQKVPQRKVHTPLDDDVCESGKLSGETFSCVKRRTRLNHPESSSGLTFEKTEHPDLDEGMLAALTERDQKMVKPVDILSSLSCPPGQIPVSSNALEDIAGLQRVSDDAERLTGEEGADFLKDDVHVKEGVASRNVDPEFWRPAHQNSLGELPHHLSVLYVWLYSKIRANIDVLCYFFFLLAYVWNFSLLMLFYPASLFLYALLVNPGPGQRFWLMMLIYTEVNILLEYMNQVLIQHTEHRALSSWLNLWLERVGIRTTMMNDSFVAGVLPLFLVYLSTLVQSSIKARDGEWMSVLSRRENDNKDLKGSSWKVKLQEHVSVVQKRFTSIFRSFFRYCMALLYGSEAPPHFVQVTMSVKRWPEDGIQPGRIESAFNKLLLGAHYSSCLMGTNNTHHSVSTLRIESIESSQAETDVVVAVLEVIYAAPRKSCPASEHYKSLTPAKDVSLEIQRAKEEGLVDTTLFPFPIISIIAGGKREVDLYAYIFGTDLTAFFFTALFYQSFIKNSPDFLNVYQLEDQFPKEFVFVLMTLFFLIVLDRVIYLCSFALAKVFYYFFSLCLFTYYVTLYGWQMSTKEHGLLLLRIFCLIKGLSLSFQASQIKYGLPSKTALYEQFLTRKVSHLNHIGFRLYRSLPFLFELRCILDWSCSTTSLAMYDWLKLEDIYASLYLVKCDAKLHRKKHHLGDKRGAWSKFFSGICTFLVLICIIWAPMLMYSSGNPTNFANPVLSVRVQIDLDTGSGRFTLYQTSLCRAYPMEELVASGFSLDAQLQAYDLRDVQLICCEADADTLWLVPPPTLRRLTNLVHEAFSIIVTWEFTRQRPKTKEVAYFINETLGVDLDDNMNDTFSVIRILELHPRYFRVPSTGDVRMLEGTMEMVSGNLTLNQDSQPWWSFSRDAASINEGCGTLEGPIAIAVSEEVPPQGLIGDTLSRFSITSLYITFVLAVGRFIRLQCADLRMRIPYENLPSCDRLIAICEDIYAARAAGELSLEEGLFWTLIQIYRSPHALLEYTKVD